MNTSSLLSSIASMLSADLILVVIVITVFDGARLIALGERRWRGWLTLTVGILLVLVQTALAVNFARAIDLPGEYAQTHADKDWDYSQLDPAELETLTRMQASSRYLEHGQVGTYFDVELGWRDYAPSAKELSLRESLVRSDVSLEMVRGAANQRVLRWCIVGLLALIAGWLLGRFESSQSSRPKAG